MIKILIIMKQRVLKVNLVVMGIKNDLLHTRGILSMARTMIPDSASSQFFIMHEDAPHLDGQYAAFGKITEGLEVVDKIANAPRNSKIVLIHQS